ncbi:MAG: F0F1 ATP synthase subunit alpha [Bacillota bacterium]
MELSPEGIASAIRRHLAEIGPKLDVYTEGTVAEVGDGIARLTGLQGAMLGELVEFPGGAFGIVLNLEENSVGVALLGSDVDVREGDRVRGTGRVIEVPSGDAVIGRVVNALGHPIDGKGPINTATRRPIEHPAPGIVMRKPVSEPLQTGLIAIDSMVPIGRGQRELIIGDRQTGKTAIAVDTILNQRDKGVICVYVAIGQKRSTIAKLVKLFEDEGAMDYTVVVAASASELAPLQYVAPYAGCAIAEEFMYSRRHALIVYDDLSKHAIAYRATTLLLRRPPGREAFPGDVFYLHSRLLERSAKLAPELGGGSITALPIVETLAGDVSAYIPTNVISITDGQIFLESELFFAGIRPAINVGLSVSRVGGEAQVPAMKRVASRLRLDLAQYRELSEFAQFGTELDPDTRARLEKGKRIVEVLKQPQYQPMPVEDQVMIIFAVVHRHLDDVPVEAVASFKTEFIDFMHRAHPGIAQAIAAGKELDDDMERQLASAIGEFKKTFRPEGAEGPLDTSPRKVRGGIESQVIEGA